MRMINQLVVHASATPASMDIGAKEIDRWHREKGWLQIGYHYVIRRDGTVEDGRPIGFAGAHARGHNRHSIGICMIGGENGIVHDMGNYTPEQMRSLFDFITKLKEDYPEAEVLGHRDFPNVNKTCPCFDVRSWWAGMNSPSHPVSKETDVTSS